MDYDEAVIEFLSQKENLRLGFEIAERVPEVKRQIEIRFWHMCFDKLTSELAASKWAATWSVKIDDDNDLTKEEYGVNLVPSQPGGDDQTFVYYLTNWTSTTLNLCVGIYLASEDRIDRRTEPAIRELCETLSSMDYNGSKWSAARKEVASHGGANEFLLDLAERSEELAVESVDILWAMFEQTVIEVEKANRQLQGQP